MWVPALSIWAKTQIDDFESVKWPMPTTPAQDLQREFCSMRVPEENSDSPPSFREIDCEPSEGVGILVIETVEWLL